MTDYIVIGADLENVADAIRDAGDTSSLLTWPDGFVTAIGNISGGGGGGGTDVSDTTTTAADALAGTYLHIADGTKVEGTMATKSGTDLTASAAKQQSAISSPQLLMVFGTTQNMSILPYIQNDKMQ